MRRQYDLIVFDWDGTLIDSIGWIVDCLRHAAKVCDLPDPNDDDARAVIGLSLGEAMETLFSGITSTDRDALVQAYGKHYYSQEMSRDHLFVGVPEMLDNLKLQGYRLAVATGKGRAGLKHAMQATGTKDLFNASRCADETASKPHPRMLLEIMGETGALPERTLMIGDSIHDLKMADNAQVASVAVTCGANSREQLLAHNPLYCLHSTVQLMDILL